ncbi:MAG: DUF61 family protein [Euryarchaeota archaeon]|jgi:uncharacterized protein (UPF0216 family)|uniref:DUF61 family protein n=1 Tax=Methanobacterium sp. MZD130B TaxID=3394378 RepID=UPI00176E56D9|nr:DUF61 family protein [Euryarchaeota archaeon]HHT19072.1 DUF61 family protein [Methanobacterium sp.]
MIGDQNRNNRLLKKQIMSLNRHLPKERKSLKELLGENKPHVLGTDGTRHRFKRNELKKISSIIPNELWGQLKLPIYIEIDSDSSGSRITGKLECQIFCQILGRDDCDDEIYIYRPDIKLVRKILPTTSQYIFLVR